MPAVLSLPYELLLDIFSSAVTTPPSLHRRVYLNRLRNLSAFSLVHRSWTAPAQDMMGWEIRLDEEENWKRVAGLLANNRVQATGWLSIIGGFQPIVEITGVQMWERLRRVHIAPSRTCARLAYFARLPSISFCFASLALAQ